MSSIATIFKALLVHPIHPRLVHFPIAFALLGVLLVLGAWWRKDSFVERAAYYNQYLVALGTIAAAISGIISNIQRWDSAAPNATLKIICSMLLLAITIVAIYLRARNPKVLSTRPASYIYVLASLAEAALVLLLGTLGGIIVWGAPK
jgi:uncharacterized membrane protein